jgi:hypothetical protein
MIFESIMDYKRESCDLDYASKVTGEGNFGNNWNWKKKKKRISGGCALGEMKSVILFKTFLLVNLFSCAIFIQALGIEGCLYCL